MWFSRANDIAPLIEDEEVPRMDHQRQEVHIIVSPPEKDDRPLLERVSNWGYNLFIGFFTGLAGGAMFMFIGLYALAVIAFFLVFATILSCYGTVVCNCRDCGRQIVRALDFNGDEVIDFEDVKICWKQKGHICYRFGCVQVPLAGGFAVGFGLGVWMF
eukprot:TRINITY_DN4939_c0_g3_i1.p4 TRINITY_DN4939_c0_g3~~TRINITY_DN4939_c0_g3_i1.p4  ORF type:complete len:168 (-),score=20.55 TRINITY_DN4939_c0_g3_i1:933-1409(-)